MFGRMCLKLKLGFHGDLCDQLVSFYTPIVFIIGAIFFSVIYLFGTPVSCRCENVSDCQYAENVCWDKTFLTISRSEGSEELFWNVHKYLPLILLIVSLLFYLTFSGWKMFCRFLGLDLDVLQNTIGSPAGQISEDCFRRAVSQSSRQINQYLSPDKQKMIGCSGGLSFLSCRTMMTFSYIWLKLDYLFTIAVVVLGTRLITHGNFLLKGYNVVYEYIVKDVDANSTNLFPEEFICDYTVQNDGFSIQRQEIGCKMNVNSALENFFLFIWVWFAFIAIVTVLNMFVWLVRLLCCSYQSMHTINAKSSHGPGIFMCDELKLDGRFLMMLLLKKEDSFTVAEIVNELYRLSEQGVLEHEASYTQSVKGGSYSKHPPLSLQPQPTSNTTQPRNWGYLTAAGENTYEITTDENLYTRDTMQAASSNM